MWEELPVVDVPFTESQYWSRDLPQPLAYDPDLARRLLEDAFGPEQAPENRWRFHYYVVRDGKGRPLLATFFTEAIWKDDLLAAARVSQAVEERRERDRFFLTSR